MVGIVTKAVTTTRATRPARRLPADKHDERRRALATSALRTLGELGYARASLREIAQNSEFTHGVVHYYFDDKLDLIVYGVRQYKETCVHRYDGVVADATTADGLLIAFADKLVETIVDEGPMHRLWYDLRSQAMFEESLREAVLMIDKTLEAMVWRVVARYAELDGRQPAVPSDMVYALLDGLFQQALLGHVCGRAESLSQLRTHVRDLLPRLVS
jgi:TetR/AcrR family transcriptional repressor of bet genes